MMCRMMCKMLYRKRVTTLGGWHLTSRIVEGRGGGDVTLRIRKSGPSREVWCEEIKTSSELQVGRKLESGAELIKG